MEELKLYEGRPADCTGRLEKEIRTYDLLDKLAVSYTHLAQRCTGRPAIALINKEDKPTQFDAELIAPCFAMVLPVCCQEEESRKVISAAVARLLGTSQIDPLSLIHI